jgi:hypothetical protein
MTSFFVGVNDVTHSRLKRLKIFWRVVLRRINLRGYIVDLVMTTIHRNIMFHSESEFTVTFLHYLKNTPFIIRAHS